MQVDENEATVTSPSDLNSKLSEISRLLFLILLFFLFLLSDLKLPNIHEY